MIDLPEARLVAHVLAQAGRAPSPATRTRLAQALFDWFTAGRSAAELPAAASLRALSDALMPPGRDAADASARVFGGASTTPLGAAFANAGIAHLREIDDAHRTAMLHPGVVAIGPALALAPALSLTRARVAAAVVAGYEVSLRIGEAMGAGHAARFHATATAGCVGAAASAAVALGLGPDALHDALGLAATQAAGLWQLVDDGAHASKSLHPAFAVRNGITAAYAARAGFPGAKAFVTGARGLYRALSGDGPLAVLDADLDLDAPARIHTATIKAWPACAMLFTPLDATKALVDAHAIRADQVASVDVELFPHALKIAGIDWPTAPAEASFSLRYLIAVLLERGAIGIADTESPDTTSPSLQALGRRVRVTPVDALQEGFPALRRSRVAITLVDGRRVEAYRELRRGDPEDPFDWPGLEARLRAFAPSVDDATATRLSAWCRAFEDPSRDDEPAAPDAALFGAADAR